jgi:glucose-6-phosphate isomerase
MNNILPYHFWRILEESATYFDRCNVNYIENETHKVKLEQLELDFSQQKISPQVLQHLFNLAEECNVSSEINRLFSGARVNESENLPALHTALRAMNSDPIWVDNKNIIPDIVSTRQHMAAIAEKVSTHSWLGYSGKPIKSIVNIGMGGSDFGPRLCHKALSEYAHSHLEYFFISDADSKAFANVLRKICPETTLFIIASKSFNSPETLYNMRKAISWISSPHWHHHFIAITAHPHKANKLGFQHILPIWEWVGGRFSLCSAINLITCIALGYDLFEEILAGAHFMDNHFRESRLEENIPVILALLGIWNINFLKMNTHLLMVYASQLELLIPYIQQLDMESNGKTIDKKGSLINYATSPIVWGGLGNQAQHSYYQLLCQGSHNVASDFISLNKMNEMPLNSYCNNTIRVLSEGCRSENISSPFIKGGMPINHIKIDDCTPYNLGMLVAMYEHKIYVQSIIWNINPFDQPGVEKAKKLALKLT